jgi:hypothetical protein
MPDLSARCGNLGLALGEVGRFEEAISVHRDAAAIFREAADLHREYAVLNNLERTRAAQAEASESQERPPRDCPCR